MAKKIRTEEPQALLFDGKSVVLLSGGRHSAYAGLCAMRTDQTPVEGVFLNHSQSEGPRQEPAVHYVAQRLGLEITTLQSGEIPEIGGGDYEGRNEILIRECVSNGAKRIWMGIRHTFPWFDRRGDSNLIWLRRMEALYSVEILAPCAYDFTGARIIRALEHHGVFPARLS